MLTNFRTIRTRIERLSALEEMFESGAANARPKAERVLLQGELDRLNRYLGGIRAMTRLPDAIFVVDPTKEAIAVKEAGKLGIPVVALADTDSDPDVHRLHRPRQRRRHPLDPARDLQARRPPRRGPGRRGRR
jgi:small subunit ribosomal protein S2